MRMRTEMTVGKKMRSKRLPVAYCCAFSGRHVEFTHPLLFTISFALGPSYLFFLSLRERMSDMTIGFRIFLLDGYKQTSIENFLWVLW